MTTSAASRRQALRLGLVGLVGSGLAGCADVLSLPGNTPPPEFYRLTPKSTFGEDLPRVLWQLVLEPPLADAGLNTTRVALQRQPTTLEYYARASWTDRAPLMVQTLMIESFENSGKIISIGRESVGLRADFVLKSELREFQINYFRSGAPQAQVGLNAKLVAIPERVIVGSQSFESLVPAASDTMPSLIAAFDDAHGKVMKRLVEWTLTLGEEVDRRRRGR